MLGKAVDDTDYEAKIQELEKEIKRERAQFREKDKKKIEEHKKHNYGAEYREFAEKQLETLDYRVKWKKEQNSLREVKRQSRSPEKPRTIETTMTLKGDQYLLIQPKTVRKFAADEFDVDHIRIVSNDQATGRFKSGKSVPKARPTMFWEAREQDFKFNLEKRL